VKLPSGRQRARPGATFVAVVVLLCQATAWVHAAATPHVTCLEHGESVHLASGGEGAQGAGPAILAATTPATTHAHEHCNLQGQSGGSAPVPERSVVRALFAPVPQLRAPRVRPAAALLRFAPKTSPPPAPAV
jgi:hypothetical protein